MMQYSESYMHVKLMMIIDPYGLSKSLQQLCKPVDPLNVVCNR